MTLELRVLEKIRDVSESSWNALVSETSSPFVEYAWLECLEEAGCVGAKTAWIPRHLALYDDGKLVAAAPAYAKLNSEGEFVFDWSWADLSERLGVPYYPKLIVAVPFTPASGDRILVAKDRNRDETVAVFARALREIVKELGLSSAHVLFPNEGESRAWEAAGLATRLGVQYHWHNRPADDPRGRFTSFEDFLATLPQKKRTQIRRERKQPAMDGMTLTTLGPDDLDAETARAMYELYTTTVDKYFYGRRYLNARFFDLVRERFASRLAWVVAKKDGDIVASAFNVKKGDTLYGRYWGTHVDRPFLHFNVCYYHGVDQAIREGLAHFNPGAGGEHKRIRGFVPTTTYSAHHIANPRMRGIVAEFLGRERAAVSAYIASGGKDEDEPSPT